MRARRGLLGRIDVVLAGEGGVIVSDEEVGAGERRVRARDLGVDPGEQGGRGPHEGLRARCGGPLTSDEASLTPGGGLLVRDEVVVARCEVVLTRIEAVLS